MPKSKIFPAIIDEQSHLCGYVHSYETGAAVDGPGMRFVVFLSGCQFRCLYCHNPDTWKMYDGKLTSIDKVIDEIGKYSEFLRFAGGLTISGGEPLMQAHFTREIFYRAKKNFGLHTALDTQGFLAGNLEDSWFEIVDLILLDIKHINPQKYLKITSQELQPTLDFVQRLIDLNKKIWIRYVLVPNLSDDEKDIEDLAKFISELNNQKPELNLIERVEVLPFHQLGISKWQNLNLYYKLADTKPPTRELIAKTKKQFENYGLICY